MSDPYTPILSFPLQPPQVHLDHHQKQQPGKMAGDEEVKCAWVGASWGESGWPSGIMDAPPIGIRLCPFLAAPKETLCARLPPCRRPPFTATRSASLCAWWRRRDTLPRCAPPWPNASIALRPPDPHPPPSTLIHPPTHPNTTKGPGHHQQARAKAAGQEAPPRGGGGRRGHHWRRRW